MKISLAMSGGGFRATVYHLGMLARLARENHLEDVTLLSTVSGGSLCAGLIYSLNGVQWPGSEVYLKQVEPEARRLLTTFDMQGALIWRVLGTFWTLLETRASVLSALLQKHWNMTARLKDLPAAPRWMINTTCYETGKNWRFERFRYGDYLFGYSSDTDLPLSDAIAASAGFPGLIGALGFKTAGRSWFRYEDRSDPFAKNAGPEEEANWKKVPVTELKYPEVHLWDGGVYDNNGLEGIHDFEKGWSYRFGFLIVSDASGGAEEEPYRKGIPTLMRLASGIMMKQVRALRTRAILERLQNHGDQDQGVFLQMGNSCSRILKSAKHADWIPQFAGGSMTEEDVHLAAITPTVIRKLSPEEYELLYHHGYEVADATLCAYYPEVFKHIPYSH
jgi:NTE family protein